MAMIIPLTREADTASDVSIAEEERGQTAAEIILFPGVRYERWADADDLMSGDGEEQSATVSARDWLEI